MKRNLIRFVIPASLIFAMSAPAFADAAPDYEDFSSGRSSVQMNESENTQNSNTTDSGSENYNNETDTNTQNSQSDDTVNNDDEDYGNGAGSDMADADYSNDSDDMSMTDNTTDNTADDMNDNDNNNGANTDFVSEDQRTAGNSDDTDTDIANNTEDTTSDDDTDDNDDSDDSNDYEDIVPINQSITDIKDLYHISEVTIRNIKVVDNEYRILTNADKQNASVYYTVNSNTPIFSLEDDDFIHPREIDEDMDLIVIYSVNTPVALSEPAVIAPELILAATEDMTSGNEYKIDYFDQTGTSADRKLKINVSDNTNVINLDGESIDSDSALDSYCVVIYRNTTRSIPPQTNPVAVIVLSEAENNTDENESIDNSNNNENENTEDEETMPEQKDLKTIIAGLGMDYRYEQGYENHYAIRPIAEELGYNVHWHEETETITLSNGERSVTMRLGVQQANIDNVVYNLETEPYIRNERAFTDIGFFEQLL